MTWILSILDFIKRHYKGFLSGLAVLAFGLYVRGCTKEQEEAKHSPLPPNVVERVSVKHGIVTLETQSGLKRISGVREGSLTLMKDGTSKLEVKTNGWEHEVGMNGFVNRDGGALGLDLRAYYWRRLDAMVGLGYAPRTERIDLWLGLGYTLQNSWISNTTIFVGYSIRNNPIAGISVRF